MRNNLATKSDLREMELRLTHQLMLQFGTVVIATVGIALALIRVMF